MEVPLIVNPFSFLVFYFKTMCDPRPFFFVCEDRTESKIEQQNVTTFIIKGKNLFLLTTMMFFWHNEVLNRLAATSYSLIQLMSLLTYCNSSVTPSTIK